MFQDRYVVTDDDLQSVDEFDADERVKAHIAFRESCAISRGNVRLIDRQAGETILEHNLQRRKAG